MIHSSNNKRSKRGEIGSPSILPAFTASSIHVPLSSCPPRVPLLTASIHCRHISFRDLFSTEMAEWKVSKADARKMDTPLSWNMLLGRELLEWWLLDLLESRPKAGRVKSCFLLHLLPPWWLWSPGTPLPSSPSILVAFTIRHSSLFWKMVTVFLILYEISGYTY